MNVVIAESPLGIGFSNNPISYKIAFKDDAGQPLLSKAARCKFIFANDSFDYNDVITIQLTDESGFVFLHEEFTLVETNPQNINQVVVDVANFDQEAMQAVLNAINAHPHLIPYVYCFQGVDGIHAESKLTDSFTIEWLFNPVKNFTKSFFPYQDPNEDTASYAIIIENNLNAQNFQEIFKGDLINNPDTAESKLNISDVIHNKFLSILPENPFKHYPTNNNSVITDNIRRFYCRFLNKYDEIKYVMLGGISNRRWLTEDYLHNIDENNSLLTYQPNYKKIFFNSKEWITWLCYPENGKVYLRVKRYKDGLSQTTEVQITTAIKGLCKTFCITPDVLNLDSDTSHFSIQIFKGNDAVSPQKTYIIENLYERYRSLAYINAFGCPETIHCKGAFSHTINITSDVYQIIRNNEAGSQIIVNKRIKDSIKHKYIYRTGYLTSEEKEAYAEVLASCVLYDVTTPQYFALQIVDNKSKDELINEEGEHLYSWEFVCVPIIQESNFEPSSVSKSVINPPEPPAFPLGLGGISGGIQSGLRIFELTQSEFDTLKLASELKEGIYRITDNDNVYMSGEGTFAVNIKYGPLRFFKSLGYTGASATVTDIHTTNDRIRVYRGNFEIFSPEDFSISINQINFTTPLDLEDIRIFY